MATRSKTELFMRMREDAVQNRKLASGDCDSLPNDDEADNSALVTIGSGAASYSRHRIADLPPEWVDGVEEIQFEITKIKQRVPELQALHTEQLNRPTLDDDCGKEQEIEIMTQNVTAMFHRCQKLIQQIGKRSQGASAQEKRVTKNVMSSMAMTLQDLSVSFRSAQSSYLKRLKNREERQQAIFNGSAVGGILEEVADPEDELYDKAFTAQQLGVLEDNTRMVDEREKEILSIAQSIADLNDIFRELASMVAEQGTILDRIDYNVEMAAVKIEEGHKQLLKAEQHQKSTRKMLCILILLFLVVGAAVVYIGLKVANK